MMKEARSSPWADLQPELLGLLLLWLPSLVDRVRLRAVCRTWRSNARLQPLPSPLPCLTLLDGTFLSIPDGKIIRMPAQGHAFCCGSVDSWLIFAYGDGTCSLVNPFSKATLDLPKLSTYLFDESSPFGSPFKLVVPSRLESSEGPLVVALISHYRVCVFQQSIATSLCMFNEISDIAFFNGKLYGVGSDVLSIFEINCGLNSIPKISCIECITKPPKERAILDRTLSNGKALIKKRYLVECCGRLLMVMRLIEFTDSESCRRSKCDRTAAFEVFEADLSIIPGRWRYVSKLDGQALFVGKHCSRSFPAGGYTGIQEDCIYFMCDYCDLAADPLQDSGVYNMRTGIITPLLSETAAMPRHRGGRWCPTWIFPDDAM